MASPAVAARLRYLNDSAHLLVTTAPSTSAYVMSRCNHLLFDQSLEQSESQRRHICGACGSIMVLGRTATRRSEALKIPKRGHSTLKIESSTCQLAKAIIYTCELCRRQTRQYVNNFHRKIPTNVSRRKYLYERIQMHSNVSNVAANNISPDKTSSSALANASSKRRAKTRKQGGLLALLAKSKENSTRDNAGGYGLDLLDFFKKI